jgi:hypothetical protein
MSVDSSDRRKSAFAIRTAGRFLRTNGIAAVAVSVLLLVPCFWHSRIQAGDLGSHVYNAWLAQLIEHHQVSGLIIVRQSNNVLFDLLLLHVGNLVGFAAAEKIVVSFAVLVFFWGAFSFLAEFSGRPPWQLTPFLFLLAYGYVFHMGFMNYYLSIGFALFALALAWRRGAGNWLLVAALSALSLFAHPIGFLLFVSIAAYVRLWRRLSRWPRVALPVIAVFSVVIMKFYFAVHEALQAGWRSDGLFQLLGQDQLNLFGHRYVTLSWVVLAWGGATGLAGIYDWIFRARQPSAVFRLAIELYALAVIATFCLPENFRVNLYAGWVGLLVSRLTLVTAIFALLVLASFRLPRWSVCGMSLCSLAFFLFLYQDTGKLDRMEVTAREAIQTLAPGTRIVAVANPPEDWRVPFIYHSIDRACIKHCFSFANYEPSSLQFRVRALPGNYFVTTAVDQSDDMSSGDYSVKKEDLPLTSIYQCDEVDWTQLCALPLRAGQKTEDPESDPGPITDKNADTDQDSQPEN